MNTLNNIHALIDINAETAKDAVIRLSTLMRYLLYETSEGHIALKKKLILSKVIFRSCACVTPIKWQ